MKKLVSIFVFNLLLIGAVKSQEALKFTVGGKAYPDSVSNATSGIQIVIMCKGKKFADFTTVKGHKFSFDLPYQADYRFIFKKQGYITKEILLSTKVPAANLDKGFDPYWFNVELYGKKSKKAKIPLHNPVGSIKYFKEKDAFDYEKFEKE